MACVSFAVFGCRSTPVTDAARSARELVSEFTPAELVFIHVDSEVFEGVVRGQLAGTEKEHPYDLDFPIFDSRPFGLDSGYARYFATLTTEDSSFPKILREEVVDRVTQNRKSILHALHVDEGTRTGFRCPGLLVTPTFSGNDSLYRAQLAKLRAECPTKPYSHLEVSPPIRGVSSSIRRRLALPGPRPSPKIEPNGELWTAIVDGVYASKGGAMADEYAWVFQRDATTGRLKLVTTSFIMISE